MGIVARAEVQDRHRFSYPVRVRDEGDWVMFDRSPLDQPCPRVFIRPEAPPSPAGESLVSFVCHVLESYSIIIPDHLMKCADVNWGDWIFRGH